MIGFYDTTQSTWECLHHFVPETFDLDDFTLSGEGQYLIIWDSPLKCKILVYKINFTPSGVSGVSYVAKFSPYENTSLGLREIKISPNKQYIVGGFFD